MNSDRNTVDVCKTLRADGYDHAAGIVSGEHAELLRKLRRERSARSVLESALLKIGKAYPETEPEVRGAILESQRCVAPRTRRRSNV